MSFYLQVYYLIFKNEKGSDIYILKFIKLN